MPETPSRLTRNVAALVEHLGGQSATSRRLGLRVQSVHDWVHGRTTPSREHVAALADLVHVHPADLEYGDVAAVLAARKEQAG